MILAVIMVMITAILCFSNTKCISAEDIYNTEQKTNLNYVKSLGINFAYDDNYAQLNLRKPDNRKTYYFSASGSDKNNGLSPKSPKRDPFNFYAKDNINILLKGGDTFAQKYATKVGSNVYIGTYGSAQRAVVSLAYTNSKVFHLVDTANNIYAVSLDLNIIDLGHISIDNINYWAKKLDNKLERSGEYYCDIKGKTLYLKSDVNLEGKKVTVSLPYYGFLFKNSINSSINNIEIRDAGIHGIRIIDGCSNIIVNNCYVHDIGGAISDTGAKYGNGIEVWGSGCKNIFVTNNVVDSCFDAGITAQVCGKSTPSENIIFSNNIVKNCNYGFEFFQYKSTPMKNVVVANNIICNAKDITNGYRLTWSKTDFTAPFCLWYSDRAETSISIVNNFAYSNGYYGISYATGSTQNVYSFANNSIIVDDTSKMVSNPKNYSGDYKQFLVSGKVNNINGYKAFINGSVQ